MKNRSRLFYHADEDSTGKWIKVADENNPFTVNNVGTLARYGKGSVWITKTFDPGTYIGSTGTFGDDPVPNVFKEVQLWVPSSLPQTSQNNSGYSTTIPYSDTKWYDASWVKWAGGIIGFILLLLLIKSFVK